MIETEEIEEIEEREVIEEIEEIEIEEEIGGETIAEGETEEEELPRNPTLDLFLRVAPRK